MRVNDSKTTQPLPSDARVVREVERVIGAHRQREGGGFIVRRPVPTAGLVQVDPFLLIDEMGPVDYTPGQAVGAPDHPHRGFETVTYMLEGEMEHEDSAGHRGALRTGDVQWMTAGAGIVHSEMPSRRIMEQGGRVHGFQIWINLPARLKMTQPKYQTLLASDIPDVELPDKAGRMRVIAGAFGASKGPAETFTPMNLWDVRLNAGGGTAFSVPAGHNATVFVCASTSLPHKA